MHIGDDKDAAFFPEPVLSPGGVMSLAFYHLPMLHLSSVDGRAAIQMIEKMPFSDRESIRMGYIPLDAVLSDHSKLRDVAESALVMSPDAQWGSLKLGCGTPPVRIAEGWFSLFHGVDAQPFGEGKYTMQYSAGFVVHDLERPHIIRYRSRNAVMVPEGPDETHGIVNDVVFPTAIEPIGERTYEFFYGMADARIGRARLELAEPFAGAEESAA